MTNEPDPAMPHNRMTNSDMTNSDMTNSDMTNSDMTNSDNTGGDLADTTGYLSISRVLDSLQPDFPDVSVSKIRFLESRGLVSPHRAPSGYRRFSAGDIDRLRWILTMQRDHFLPLRVIKERLDSGIDPAQESGGGDTTENVPGPAPDSTARTAASRFRAPGPESERLAPDDLARLAGLSAAQLDELVRFGLVESQVTPEGVRFEREELRVAQAAGSFLLRGIEARHLKAWRIAAEREAGMLEQVLTPLSRQNTADATARARELAEDLIDMGNTIREAIIVKALRASLGTNAE